MLSAVVVTYQPAQPAKAAQTLKFFAPWGQTQFHDIDNQEGSRAPGDMESGRFTLQKNGAKRGQFIFVCTYATIDPVRQVCEGGMRVKGKGELTFYAAPERPNTEQTVAVISGGTGAYVGASGAVELDFSGRRGAHFTIRLR
jgi:hypothetical protein